jgi:hypothetical protein
VIRFRPENFKGDEQEDYEEDGYGNEEDYDVYCDAEEYDEHGDELYGEPTEASGTLDVDEYDDVCNSYVEARKWTNDLRLSRGFHPLVAFIPDSQTGPKERTQPMWICLCLSPVVQLDTVRRTMPYPRDPKDPNEVHFRGHHSSKCVHPCLPTRALESHCVKRMWPQREPQRTQLCLGSQAPTPPGT